MEDNKAILKSKYFYLLLSLILFFLLNPFLQTNHISNLIIAICFGIIIFFSVYAVSHSRFLFVSTLILAALSFASYWCIIWVSPSNIFFISHFFLSILFLSVITYSVITSVTRHKEITADTLFGAISGYLLIGFTWELSLFINLNH